MTEQKGSTVRSTTRPIQAVGQAVISRQMTFRLQDFRIPFVESLTEDEEDYRHTTEPFTAAGHEWCELYCS